MSFFFHVLWKLAKAHVCSYLLLESQEKVGKMALIFLAAEVSFAVSWKLRD